MKGEEGRCRLMKKDILTIGLLIGLTGLSGAVLARVPDEAFADIIDEVSVEVESSCKLESSGGNHEAIVDPGNDVNINGSVLTAFCNDANGWAIYAVGFGNDSEGNTNLSMTAGGTTYTIPTGTSGNSYWAMKLAPSGSTPLSTIVSDFQDFHSVPSSYEKVASSDTNTDPTAGVPVSTAYMAHVSSDQPAGTYVGKVRYVLAHPSTTVCPDGYEMDGGICKAESL